MLSPSPRGGPRARAFANWDPSYRSEQPSYYEEFIHRHAPINVGWLHIPPLRAGGVSEPNEAVGVGLLHDTDSAASQYIVAPLDNGSVCIWDIEARKTGSVPSQGRLVGQSSLGLLSGTDTAKHSLSDIRALMTETGAVESVSIDNRRKRGYFAQNSALVEVDLVTLQMISHQPYPFPITALSEPHDHSLVVGTNNTIHIHDPRADSKSSVDPSLTVEVIGGPTASHATLSQPGPLSILNYIEDDSIWVAGRFTHLLNYDRRFFPRLRGTVHSGARLSSIAVLPFPLKPRSMDLLQDPSLKIQDVHAAKSAAGSTLLAAGDYKGKGSIEFYNLQQSASSPRPTHFYHNRQSASSNKLLSVACHGLSTVFSDGNGCIKWIERDGSTPIRNYNINGRPNFTIDGRLRENTPDKPWPEDIVQKMIPLQAPTGSGSGLGTRMDTNQSDLVLKTADGRIGILGFGSESWYARQDVEEVVETFEEKVRRDRETSYTESMGRLLDMHADEAMLLKLRGMTFR